MNIGTLIDKQELKFAQKLVNKYPIPSPPNILMSLNTEVAKTDPDTRKILDLISEDIGLAANIVKTVNSPLYGLQTEIESIEHAISLLGINTLKDVIIKPTYFRALKQSIKGYETVSEQSPQIGTLAEIIALEIETSIPSGYFYLAGLFHNAGSLILGDIYPEYLKYSQENIASPITWPLLEKQEYHVRHTTIGVLLAKHWGLSNIICNAIYLHHSIISTYNKILDTDSVSMGGALQLSIYLSNKQLFQRTTEQSLECDIMYKSVKDELMLSEDNISCFEQDAQTIL